MQRKNNRLGSDEDEDQISGEQTHRDPGETTKHSINVQNAPNTLPKTQFDKLHDRLRAADIVLHRTDQGEFEYLYMANGNREATLLGIRIGGDESEPVAEGLRLPQRVGAAADEWFGAFGLTAGAPAAGTLTAGAPAPVTTTDPARATTPDIVDS